MGRRGYPDAIHPIHVGLLGVGDHHIVDRALHVDRIIVTANRADFRKLLAREPLHPDAVVVAGLEKEPVWQLILFALDDIERQPVPVDYMVNRIVEVSVAEGVQSYEMPPSEH